MKFDDFFMAEIEKKVEMTKKFYFFPKHHVMISTVTKYEFLTPRELEDINNLGKSVFIRKKTDFREQYEFTL